MNQLAYLKTPLRAWFAAAALVGLVGTLGATTIVNDVTQLNPIAVDEVITPTRVEDIQRAVAEHRGKIAIGGGRYSMGGQTASEHALQIDMRKFNRVLNLNVADKRITVEAGIRWRDIQEAIDPHNLSVKIMQTYSNFTVGGSLSVNVHGRYVGQGPIVRSVDSIKVVLADGSLVEASPSKRSEIFYGVIGGYGGLGVIVEATLQLADNVKVERVTKLVPASEYKKYFFNEIRDNPAAVFHNGDIYPPEFDRVNAVTWRKTDKPLTVTERLIPRDQKYTLQPTAISLMTTIPGGRKFRSSVVDPWLFGKEVVTWRNHEASYDVAELEPPSRKTSTFVLQEYFVPVKRFGEFIPKMRDVFRKNNVGVFNVSIRHALPDPGSILAWAREEVFAFVVYYRQGTSPEARRDVGEWTRAMIDQVLSVGGTYYLPYQIHATDEQFHRAYPKYQTWFDLKRKLDPDFKFRNKLWDRYYLSMPDEIAVRLPSLKGYKRGEDQSFLSLPEWYIVFNADEYAQFLATHRPSAFPYWQSAREFWRLKSRTQQIIHGKYPYNFGYQMMLWVIGTSYSAELLVKGAYENTVGRLTEALTSAAGTDEDRAIQRFHREYGDFVHRYPWYEFAFLKRLRDFWSTTPVRGPNWIRKGERRAFFTVEYLFKGIYAAVIRVGTRFSYDPEADKIYGVVQDPKGNLAKFTPVKVVHAEGKFSLVEFPRYDAFRDLAVDLGKQGISIVELAGNREIFLTLIRRADDRRPLLHGEILGKSAVVADAGRERLLVQVGVASLTELLAWADGADGADVTVEHVFDY